MFSRRAAQVNAAASPDATRADKLRVSQQTRHAKHDTGTATDQRRSWRERAHQAGYEAGAVVTAAAPHRAHHRNDPATDPTSRRLRPSRRPFSTPRPV